MRGEDGADAQGVTLAAPYGHPLVKRGTLGRVQFGDRAQLSSQPPGQPFLVLLGVRPEPVRSPDLLAMPLDPITLPVGRRPRLRRHLHLLGHALHRGGRNFPGRLRQPGLHLEELQQQREPEPGRPPRVPVAFELGLAPGQVLSECCAGLGRVIGRQDERRFRGALSPAAAPAAVRAAAGTVRGTSESSTYAAPPGRHLGTGGRSHGRLSRANSASR